MKFYAKIFILLLLCFSAFAEEPASKNVFADSFISLMETADPDFPCFNISYEGGWPNAMFGANIEVAEFSQPSLRYVVFLTPFLNLYSRGAYLIPFAFWRGGIGAKIHIEMPELLPKNQRLGLRLGLSHESGHFTGYYSSSPTLYYWSYGDPYFAYFDFIEGKLSYQYKFENEKINLLVSCGGKYGIDKLIGAGSERNTLWSYSLESIINAELSRDSNCFLSAYYELMHSESDFSDIIKNYSTYTQDFSELRNYNCSPQEYFYAKLGLNFTGEGKPTYQPYLMYMNANGRGVDYLLKRQVFGFGLRIII